MKKLVIVKILILISVIIISAQNSSVKNASEYLRRAEANGFSGQVLISEKGKVLLNQQFGLADREQKISVKANTALNIASFTKQFTTTAILKLEADGKLQASDSIAKYLENVPADKSDITIHQLMTHTAGFSRGQDGRKNTTRDETVAAILQQKLSAKVGEKFIYSNAGYHLLAAIIEKVSGQTYQQYLSENLFKPAGMSNSGFYQDEKWSKIPIAQSYNEWKKLPNFTQWNKGWNYGSGSIISTSDDLFKWFQALQKNKVLPESTKEKLFKEYNQAFDKDVFYGYGWYIQKLKDGKKLIFHGGDNPGYHAEVRWYREDDRIIIILNNYESLEPDGVAIQKRVIANNLNRILLGEAYKQPLSFMKISAKDQKKYEGEYKLPSGARYKVWNNGNYLSIGAEGQEAINSIAGYEGETAKKYAEANDITQFILENIKNEKLENIKTRLAKDDYSFYIPFLAKEIKEFEEKLGKLKEIKVQGTTSFPWDENSYRTNVILQFEKGKTDLFLGFENGKLNDVTTETGRPFPLIMPLVPNTKNNFSTFEFLKAKQTLITFSDSGELKVKNKDGDLLGNKVPTKR